MKKLGFIFLPALAFFHVNAQTEMIKEIFRLLPADKIFNLAVASRDSMLRGQTYYPADNDSDEIQAYNYGTSEYLKDYMYVSMSFETGQRGSAMIEIRTFKTLTGDNLVMVSKTGGVWQVAYSQHDLSVYIYGKDKKLTLYKRKVLPTTDESIFMKPGIPVSMKKLILNNSDMTFDLSNEKLTVSLNSYYISRNNEARKWLKGDRLYLDWTGNHFVISKTEFQNAN